MQQHELYDTIGGGDIMIKDLAAMVGDVVGFDGTIELDLSKPDGTPRKLMEIERLYQLGWQPDVALGEGVRRSYEDFKKNAQYSE